MAYVQNLPHPVDLLQSFPSPKNGVGISIYWRNHESPRDNTWQSLGLILSSNMDDWLIYYLGCSPAQDAGTRFLGDRGSQPKPLFATVRSGDNPRYRSLDSFASKFELLKHPQKLSNFFGMMFSPTENFKKKKKHGW